MKELHYTIPKTDEYSLPYDILQQCAYEKLLFFDIETTGFSAINTTLYLIGALFYEEQEIHIVQWFNEDGFEEEELIRSFQAFAHNFTHLIHFNGNGFDLPYLMKKASQKNISFQLQNDCEQIDIYKRIKPYKKILNLENLKQTSIEQFLQIQRDDEYTGKELISVYKEYVRQPSKHARQLLLLHNHDDLLGMPKICQILNYPTFFENLVIHTLQFQIEDDSQKLMIHFEFIKTCFLPKRITHCQGEIFLNADENYGTLSIPIYRETFLYFFPDYKNYYYLPQEDMAIHKSIATYVEPKNRIRATKKNCYTKKEGSFIPCFSGIQSFQKFRKDADETQEFILLQNFLSSSKDIQEDYIKTLLSSLLM